MSSRFHIPGYAIVSADHMIADSTGIMPPALIFDADKEYFQRELDRADILIHGRHSYEWQPNSAQRRRLILTRQVPALAPSPDYERGMLWNPAGAPFEEACASLGVTSGIAAVLGGPEVYNIFFPIGYDAFYLCRASSVKLPGGVPVFPQVKLGQAPEEVLADFGYAPGPMTFLDEANGVTLVSWTPKKSD
ncbi:MAG TPA: dihydrofolate reductase [Roseiarcus sp.]|nr:dihydrofolate reductase [Roseiarcus sp.]